jgi:hypothetical protein
VLENPWFTSIELKKDKKDKKTTYSCPYSITDVPAGEVYAGVPAMRVASRSTKIYSLT